MPRWTQRFGMLAVMVAVTASAWSQTAHYTVPAASVENDFAAYRQALDSATDSALANMMREAAASNRIAEVTAKTAAPPDSTALHQFAEQYWNGNDEAVRRAVARVTELRPVLTPILRDPPAPCCPPPARHVLGKPRPTSMAAAALRNSRRDGSPTSPEPPEKAREINCSFTLI